MKLSRSILIGFICFLAATTSSSTQSNEGEIKRLTRQLVEAHARKDIPTLNRLLSDNVVITNVAGRQLNKTQALQELGSTRGQMRSFDFDNVKVNFITSDRAILSCRLTAKRTDNQAGKLNLSVTWERRQSGLQVVQFVETAEPAPTEIRALSSRVTTPLSCGFIFEDPCNKNCPTGQTASCKCVSCGEGWLSFLCRECDCICVPGCSRSDQLYVCENEPSQLCNPNFSNCRDGAKCIQSTTCPGFLPDFQRSGQRSRPVPRNLPVPAISILGNGPPIIVPPNTTVLTYALFPTSTETFINVLAKTGNSVICNWGDARCSWNPGGSYTYAESNSFTNNTGQNVTIEAMAEGVISDNGGGAVDDDLGILGWGYTITRGRPGPSPITGTFTPHRAILLVVRGDGVVSNTQSGALEGKTYVYPKQDMMFHVIFPTDAATKLVVEAQLPNQPSTVIWEPEVRARGNYTFRWTNDSNGLAVITVKAFTADGEQLSAGEESYNQQSLDVFGFGRVKAGGERHPYRVIFISTPEK